MLKSKDGNLKDDEQIYVRTDLEGRITLANNAFFKLSGFSKDDLIGSKHNVLRHNLMPSVIYDVLWHKIKRDETVIVFFKNLSKSGKEYWIVNEISPLMEYGKKVGYLSQGGKAPKEAIKEIEILYDLLIQVEKKENFMKSKKALANFLYNKKMIYSEYVGYLLEKEDRWYSSLF